MEATVYVLVAGADAEKAKAELEAIGWKAHGTVIFTTSMGIPMEVYVMRKD